MKVVLALPISFMLYILFFNFQTVLMAVMKVGVTQNTTPMRLPSVITLTVLCLTVFAPWTVRLFLVGWTPKTPRNLFTSLLTTLLTMTIGNYTKKDCFQPQRKIPMDAQFTGLFMHPMNILIMLWLISYGIKARTYEFEDCYRILIYTVQGVPH